MEMVIDMMRHAIPTRLDLRILELVVQSVQLLLVVEAALVHEVELRIQSALGKTYLESTPLSYFRNLCSLLPFKSPLRRSVSPNSIRLYASISELFINLLFFKEYQITIIN
jgi:hypothetical protein